MKRGFMGSSKKEPADSRTIRKQHCSPQHCSWQYCSSSVDQHCHPVSIDTVHPASIDTVNPALSDTVHSALIDTVHPASIDTVHHASIDTVHHASIDTVHPASTDFVHPDTVHRDTVCCDTVQTDTVHPMKNDTTCGETGKIEVLILKVDENGMLRDEEGCTRNSALLDDIMAKRDEQHVSGELSRVEEAGTE
ncbi:hypothetical protein F2Q69_00053244 [Brassica cretica]|uniref:Uncharacterized protein n=1 Tax=Brassica cretica TaxID=69181 RepID=A0A8S9N169_BRACR|nr:hypothetical protein F2Q69_00053244 [Brassica cretica]